MLRVLSKIELECLEAESGCTKVELESLKGRDGVFRGRVRLFKGRVGVLKGHVSSTQLECFKVESEILEVESYVCFTFRISAIELEF